ncbi:MAG TPA: 5-formyltetrahydrofolate cyclo-ligase [Gammaproteobacteria bacterium]|nr:5-formyltetrahydrofolate cyclo-ligase [Gammaproteobacteria bacterium]
MTKSEIPDYSSKANLLRRELKQRRAAISPHQRERAGRLAWQHLRYWPVLRRAKKVACYLAMPGEFPTETILQGLLNQEKEVYVPVVDQHQQRKMVFQRYRPNAPMRQNRYGIIEPVELPRQQINATRLDLILMPLLGFDHCGTRIGMGGGYYDTSLAFRLEQWRMKKTRLVGLAFDVQHCHSLERNHWDVPLDAVLTESGVRVVGGG